MDDMATWLRAQLDEDERVAQEVIDWEDDRFTSHEYAWSAVSRLNGQVKRQRILAGAPTPRQMLAEVDAKRKLIELYQATRQRQEDNSAKFVLLTKQRYLDQAEFTRVKTHGWELGGQVAALATAVAVAAMPYADRPGYQEQWRPA